MKLHDFYHRNFQFVFFHWFLQNYANLGFCYRISSCYVLGNRLHQSQSTLLIRHSISQWYPSKYLVLVYDVLALHSIWARLIRYCFLFFLSIQSHKFSLCCKTMLVLSRSWTWTCKIIGISLDNLVFQINLISLELIKLGVIE